MYGLVSTKPYDDPIDKRMLCYSTWKGLPLLKLLRVHTIFNSLADARGCFPWILRMNSFMCKFDRVHNTKCVPDRSQVRKVVGIDGFYSLARFTKNPKMCLIVRFIPISYLTALKDSKLTYVLPKKKKWLHTKLNVFIWVWII